MVAGERQGTLEAGVVAAVAEKLVAGERQETLEAGVVVAAAAEKLVSAGVEGCVVAVDGQETLVAVEG